MTNSLLPLLVRNEDSPLEVSFEAVALDFQVFLAQTPKNLKEVVVVTAQIETMQQNVEMACSANKEQVFSPLDQSGLSNFALGKMPSVSTNQHSVILPSML